MPLVTRSQDAMYNLANFYTSLGFDTIPQDEVCMLGDIKCTQVQQYMTEILALKKAEEELALRPIGQGSGTKGVNEPITKHIMGKDFKKLLDKWNQKNAEQKLTTNGGRKPKRQTKKRKIKKRSRRTKRRCKN